MHVIRARNVAEALPQGVEYLQKFGVAEETRAGTAFVSPVPVTTVYQNPKERVLMSPIRDANPFFHLAEAMWMLLGRRDSAFLDNFIPDFGMRFAENGGDVHGAYGHRWRRNFQQPPHPPGSGYAFGAVPLDQITKCVEELKNNPSSRQVVLTMWDPTIDLGVPDLKDRPCNTHVYFRVQETRTKQAVYLDQGDMSDIVTSVLDMTVLCRSNDIVMGAYGANAVHFSVLQEYVAAMVGVKVGTYYQVSNNYHVYVRDIERMQKRQHDSGSHYDLATELQDHAYADRRIALVRLVDDPETFDAELKDVIDRYEMREFGTELAITNKFLSLTWAPMLYAHRAYRDGRQGDANWWTNSIEAPDWRMACQDWMERRERAALKKETTT